MHVAGADHADKRFLSTKREHQVQHAAVGCFSERMKTGLRLAVPGIWNNEQRITKEHGFRLSLRNVMFLSALSSIPFVPIKAFDPIQCDHTCILS
jgi:hypothetical protein